MKRWQFWVGIAIGAVCIAYVVSTIENPGNFVKAFREVKAIYLVPIIAGYGAIMFLRAVRWRYILNQCGQVRLTNSIVAILVCYMGNNIFPLRAGEFMRVLLIGKQEESITYSGALATVVVERLFDFLTILITLAAVLMLIPFPEEGLPVKFGGETHNLVNLIRGLGTGTLAGAVVLFVFLVLLNARTEFVMRISDWALSLFARVAGRFGSDDQSFFREKPARLRELALAALERFASGLTIMSRPRALVAVMAQSILIWVVNLSPVWVSGLAFGIELDLTGCLFLLVVGGAAASIPGPPGFFGIFHAFTQMGVIFYMGLLGVEISDETALSYAIILHGCYYFPVVIAGAIAAWVQGYSLTKLREEAEDAEENLAEEADCPDREEE